MAMVKSDAYGHSMTRDPELALTLNNLAFVHEARGDHAESRSLYERALASLESAHGSDHPQVINVRRNFELQ